MTHYPDLEPCTCFDRAEWPPLPIRAVGWLAGDRSFDRGPAPADFVVALFALLDGGWDPTSRRGWHTCEICGQSVRTMMHASTGVVVKTGVRNLFVPQGDRAELFAAPSLIAHYVMDHEYLPPDEFRAAVASCPRGSAYFERVGPILPSTHPWYANADRSSWSWLTGYGEALAREHGLISRVAVDLLWNDRHARRRLPNYPGDYALPAPDPALMERHHRPLIELARRMDSTGHAERGAALRAWAEQVEWVAEVRAPSPDEQREILAARATEALPRERPPRRDPS